MPSFHCPLKGSSHQSTEGHSIALSTQGSSWGWVFPVSMGTCMLHSAPFCPLGGSTLWITSLQLTCSLASMRFGQGQALARDQRGRGVSTSGNELPPTAASFPPPSQAHLCNDCNPWHTAVVLDQWDLSTDSSSSASFW